jgi:hypothetical protein
MRRQVEQQMLDHVGGGGHVLSDRLPGRTVVDVPYVGTKTPDKRGQHLTGGCLWSQNNFVEEDVAALKILKCIGVRMGKKKQN